MKNSGEKEQLPSEREIRRISALLTKKFAEAEPDRKYALVNEVLALIGAGFAAGIAAASPTIYYARDRQERDRAFKQYNPSYLRRTLDRLERRKMVTVAERNGRRVVELTKKGRRKILAFALDELELKTPDVWDSKWRLVIYDIPTTSNFKRQLIRKALQRMDFLKLQGSVYLTPFPCEDEIEFLREYYSAGGNLMILTVAKLEHDQAYRDYFGV